MVSLLWNRIWGSAIWCSSLRFGGLDCALVKNNTLECEAVGFIEVR